MESSFTDGADKKKGGDENERLDATLKQMAEQFQKKTGRQASPDFAESVMKSQVDFNKAKNDRERQILEMQAK